MDESEIELEMKKVSHLIIFNFSVRWTRSLFKTSFAKLGVWDGSIISSHNEPFGVSIFLTYFFFSTWKRVIEITTRIDSKWKRTSGCKRFHRSVKWYEKCRSCHVCTKDKSWCHVVNTSFKWMLWISEDDDVQHDDNRPKHEWQSKRDVGMNPLKFSVFLSFWFALNKKKLFINAQVFTLTRNSLIICLKCFIVPSTFIAWRQVSSL